MPSRNGYILNDFTEPQRDKSHVFASTINLDAFAKGFPLYHCFCRIDAHEQNSEPCRFISDHTRMVGSKLLELCVLPLSHSL
jgi:hypothetical protein